MNLDLSTLTQLLALATSLESEGQYNNAKLMRAAADSLLTRAAREVGLSTDRAAVLEATRWAMEALSGLDVSPELLTALDRSRAALADGRLPAFVETPDPFVCRICGYLALENSANCPTCGAHPGTFKRFRPIYWIEALDPFDAMQYLRSTPEKVAAFLDGVSGSQSDQAPEPGGWSLRQAISHLNDAQGVFDFRVNLILDQENPVLEAKAVFAWAAEAANRPATVREIFETYRASRAQSLARLERIPLKDWWRHGRHEEFGELKLYQQVSYFASHELTHFAQLENLARGSGS